MKNVFIIGAGPAGLTAGLELVKKGFNVTIIEKDPVYVGGISRTVEYNGYRFDIGGHRFFSKNKDVEKWWHDVLHDEFLLRPRLSRWYYKGKFFHYPIRIFELLKLFGPIFAFRIVLSYMYRKIFPVRPELSLADWCRNNFGDYIAKPFFIDYNKKLWGLDAGRLSKDFTQQRIKGVSFTTAIKDSILKLFGSKKGQAKSLIEKFHYPKFGPGMMWEKVTGLIKAKGGEIIMGAEVMRIEHEKGRVKNIAVRLGSGRLKLFQADYVLSTMPLKELVLRLSPAVPARVREAAEFLKYRDFITVALMLDSTDLPRDNWIYTHDEGIRSIRIQLFKNWSPFMVPDETKACIGFEYTCQAGDELWNKSDSEMAELAKNELGRLGFAKGFKIIDSKAVHLRDVYPVYEIGYDKQVDIIKEYLEAAFDNHSLQPIGRGGLHRYNNSDHSMMTAFLAVKNIAGEGSYDQWQVNSDAEYHEEL